MPTHISEAHRRAVEALTDGHYHNLSLVSCLVPDEPTAAIVAFHPCPTTRLGSEPECEIQPLFMNLPPRMTIVHHDGVET